MERLLQWAVENSDEQGFEESRRHIQQLDPEVIDMILGKDDPTRMRECIQVIKKSNGEVEESVRLQAFDELEMLIESFDNACNLEKMHMWPDVLSCLDPKESEQVARFALWIIGTAAQNNPEVQRDLLSRHNIVARVLSALCEESRELRAKALYALTALVSNHPAALEAFIVAGGFRLLEGRLSDAAEQGNLTEKTAFLLRALCNEVGPDAVFCLLEGCPKLQVLFQSREE